MALAANLSYEEADNYRKIALENLKIRPLNLLKTIMCKNPSCRYGKNCNFAHSRAELMPVPECAFGDVCLKEDCRFDHSRSFLPEPINKELIIEIPPEKEEPTNTKPSDKEESGSEPQDLALTLLPQKQQEDEETMKIQAIMEETNIMLENVYITEPNTFVPFEAWRTKNTLAPILTDSDHESLDHWTEIENELEYLESIELAADLDKLDGEEYFFWNSLSDEGKQEEIYESYFSLLNDELEEMEMTNEHLKISLQEQDNFILFIQEQHKQQTSDLNTTIAELTNKLVKLGAL